MCEAGCRPKGRLCCLALVLWAAAMVAYVEAGAQSSPATTTISDTVYRADGTPAAGTLIITWPAFVTAGGAQIAAGSTNVALGAQGSLSIGLVANAGATPAGVYYTAVYQLGPGQVKTENWVVPASASPVNLAAVRMTPGAGVAGQPVSLQYVNSELAAKANENAVVHLSGNETITGAKTFASAPSVPAPVNPGDVASKAYVDQAVSNVGAGNYLPTAGGTMTGPITLPANPAAPLQAATKSYVDSSLAAKADLVSGLVPANELGTGQATAENCLTGNGTWAPCSAGGTGNLSTTPAASQNIAQPVGTQFSVNNLANIRYVTSSWNWLQTPTDNLSTPGNNNIIHLSPCPAGLDTSSSANYYTYKVYIAGTGTPEAVAVTGGSCTPGSSGGTIIVTTQNPHAAGYTVGSASGGIQEAWNDAWTSDIPTTASSTTAPYVKLVANSTYNVYATVYLRGRGGMLDGAGALIACATRDRCIYVGTTQGSPYVHHHKLYNLTGTSSVNVDGVQVASVVATSGTHTITTASNHPFVIGDVVDCEYYSQNVTQHWVQTVSSVANSTHFTFQSGSGTISAGSNTFGFCGLLNAFLENNSDHVALQDINLTQVSGFGMGMFSYGIVNDNDQQFIIERASNRSTGVIRSDANFPMGAFVYARGDQGNAGIVYVHDSEFTNVNCIEGNSGNGLVFSDSVCQGFPVYGVRYFGGYQPATFTNVYQESTGGGQNPLYGYAATMGYVVQGGVGTKFVGTFPSSGFAPEFVSGGSGSNQRAYFVVPHSSTRGYGPVIFAGYAQPITSSTNVTIMWPSIELQDANYHQSLGTVTWDVLAVVGQSATAPYGTGTYAIASNAAVSCGTNGICSFTDTQATPVSYTVPQQQFTPVFWFWPNNLVINNTTVFLDATGSDPEAVASQGVTGISIVASECNPEGAGWRRSPIWVSCLAGPGNDGAGLFATVLQQTDSAGNGPFVNSKGRLNFGKQIGAPNDLITLADTNFLKTLATAGERPSNDAEDIAIGVDQAGGLAQRAGSSISSYINVVPNGTNFLERLASSGKTLNVPLTVNGNLTVSTGTVSLPVTGTSAQCLHVSASGVLSGTGADCGSGGSGAVTVNVGVGSQLAMYSGNGSAVSGDSALTDNGTMLTYTGPGGIAANSATLSGNLTVNGQLQVAGPWMVSSPIPGTIMSAAGPGTSSLGISDDGNFYISANGGTPQQVATTATSSYFSNVWQEGANDVGLYNGTNPQSFHVYGTTDGTNYNRLGLLYDATSQDFLLSSEWAGTGAAHNLGLRTGSSVKWEVTTGSAPNALRPYADLGATVGDAFHRPQFNYSQANVVVLPNSSSGTTLNYLAKAVSSGTQEQAQTLSPSDTSAIGIVVAGAGTTGSASIARSGEALCTFDGAVTLNDYVVPSSTTGGQCHDTGSATSCPSGQVIGRAVLQTTGSNFYVLLGNDSCGAGPGVPIDSPSFSGTVTLPDGTTDSASGITLASALTLPSGSTATTQTTGDNSTKVATTAFVLANAQPLLAGTQGKAYANKNGGSGVQTVGHTIYAEPWFTTDIFAATGSALQAAYSLSPLAAHIDATGITGARTATASLFPSSSMPSAAKISYGPAAITVNQPIVQLNRTEIEGWGAQGTSGQDGTTFVAGPNFPLGCGGNFGTSCNGTVSYAATSGSITLTGSGTNFNTVADNGTGYVRPGCRVLTGTVSANGDRSTSTALWGYVTAVASDTSLTLQVQGSIGGVQSGQAWAMDCAVFTAGDGQANPIFSVGLKNIIVSCNNVRGCVPVRNAYAEEFSYLERLTVRDYTNIGIDNEGSAAQNFDHIKQVAFAAGSSCTANTIDLVERVLGGTRNVIGEASDTHGPCSTVQNVAFDFESDGETLSSIHFEKAGIAVEVGASSNVTAPGFFIQPRGTCRGCRIESINAGGSAPYTQTLVDIGNVNPEPDVHIGQIQGFSSVNSATNLLVDSANSNTITSSCQASGSGAWTLGEYQTDESGYPRTNAKPACIQNGISINNGAISVVSGGSIKASFAATVTMPDGTTNNSSGYTFAHALILPSGSTTTTQSAGDNSTKVATTAFVQANQNAPLVTANKCSGGNLGLPSSANKALLIGLFAPNSFTTSKLAYDVTTADNTSNTYDIALYQGAANSTDNRLLHIGSTPGTTFAPSTGWKTINWQEGTTTVPAGRYLLLLTSSCTSNCATLVDDSTTLMWQWANSASVTTGGTSPASWTEGADNFTSTTMPCLVLE